MYQNSLNIFIRSALRQKLWTATIIVLIAVASFVFVMRIVEFVVVTNQINELSRFYRSVGFLQRRGGEPGEPLLYDVFVGAEIIRSSPFIDFEDRRRGFGGVLRGMMNANVIGYSVHPSYLHTAYRFHQMDSFFYGTLMSKNPLNAIPQDRNIQPYMLLTIQVDYVLHGYSEHVVIGQRLTMRYFLSANELVLDEHNETDVIPTAIDNMVIGQRYFLRGAYYFPGNLYGGHREHIPEPGSDDVVLTLVPLNIGIHINRRYLSCNEIWYIPVHPGEFINNTTLAPDNLDEVLNALRHNQSSVCLRSTVDMSALPLAQPAMPVLEFSTAAQPPIRLTAGRWIDRSDYLNSNSVAVMNADFAQLRGLELGDKITVDISREQILAENSIGPNNRPEVVISSCRYDTFNYELVLEIVGLYLTDMDRVVGGRFRLPPTHHIYIPDSLLPHNFEFQPLPYTPTQQISADIWYVNPAFADQNFLPGIWYSFVLNNPKDEAAFLLEYGDVFAEMGFNLILIMQNADAFWASAEPILQSMLFNAVMFCIVLLLVIVFVVFMYLRQRWCELAIVRALGTSVKSANQQLLSSILLLGIPAVITGSIGGWFFAFSRARSTLNPFGEIETNIPLSLDASLSAVYLFLLVGIVLAVLLSMTLFGALRISRRPVLELLQARGRKV